MGVLDNIARRNSSKSVCFRGLNDPCTKQVVDDATITAQWFEEDQITPIGTPQTITPEGANGNYNGAMPKTDFGTSSRVYLKIIVNKSDFFYTEIWLAHEVSDRNE